MTPTQTTKQAETFVKTLLQFLVRKYIPKLWELGGQSTTVLYSWFVSVPAIRKYMQYNGREVTAILCDTVNVLR